MNKENNCQCVVCNVEAALLDSYSTQMARTQFQAGARNGKLTQIPHSIAFLSTSNSSPGSVALSPDGQFLVVTEKATNNLDVFRMERSARLGPIVVNPSVGLGVFALLFAPNGAALASETPIPGQCAFLVCRPVERNALHY